MDDITQDYNATHDVPKHKKAANNAGQVLALYTALTGSTGAEALTDLLTDLRHWSQENEADFDANVERSSMHWAFETPDDDDPDATYKTIRFYAGSDQRDVLSTGLSLEDARAVTRSPESSSQTATDAEAVARTATHGDWFVGYEAE